MSESLSQPLGRIQRRSLGVGVAALALCILGAFVDAEQFFRSYLLAYLFWTGLALGSFAILMLHHLVGGMWGVVIRRLLESGTRTLPLMALLFVPFFFGLQDLYVWTRPEAVASDEILRHKSLYLNTPFFLLRTALYFAVWIGIAHWLHKLSLEQDRAPGPAPARRLQAVSAPGLVVYGLTVTFASVDWAMSLEPHWFSTIYGLLFIVGQVLTTLAFSITALGLLVNHEPLAGVIRPDHFHDLGKLLLAFVMLWAYIAVSQFLIIWSGNLPEEIPWYLHRTTGGWEWIAGALILVHFALPFLLLLSRTTKRGGRTLGAVAGALIFMRLVDLFWLVGPAFHPAGLSIHWMDFAAPVGVGGIWVGIFVWQLQKRSLLPLNDPRLAEVPGHG